MSDDKFPTTISYNGNNSHCGRNSKAVPRFRRMFVVQWTEMFPYSWNNNLKTASTLGCIPTVPMKSHLYTAGTGNFSGNVHLGKTEGGGSIMLRWILGLQVLRRGGGWNWRPLVLMVLSLRILVQES